MSLRLILVTICFNNLEDVTRTCGSVDAQTRLPDEHWIINGSTTPEIEDWSKEAIGQSFRHVVNEPDLGISDAFNKGIRKSGHGFVQLLNSGDLLHNVNVLQRIEEFIVASNPVDWISGKIQLSDGQIVGTPFEVSKLNQGMRWVAHPSWWVKKEVYLAVGEYDLRYKIAMDFDMLCRFESFNYAFYGFPSISFDLGGVSSNLVSNGQNEVRLIYQMRFGHSSRLVFRQNWTKISQAIQNNPLGRAIVRIYRAVNWRSHEI